MSGAASLVRQGLLGGRAKVSPMFLRKQAHVIAALQKGRGVSLALTHTPTQGVTGVALIRRSSLEHPSRVSAPFVANITDHRGKPQGNFSGEPMSLTKAKERILEMAEGQAVFVHKATSETHSIIGESQTLALAALMENLLSGRPNCLEDFWHTRAPLDAIPPSQDPLVGAGLVDKVLPVLIGAYEQAVVELSKEHPDTAFDIIQLLHSKGEPETSREPGYPPLL